MSKRSISVLAIAAVLMVVGLFLLGNYFWYYDRPEVIQHNISLGNQIVAALERYRAKNGVYPEHLEQLVPQELQAIPEPDTMQRRWDYYRPPDKPDYFYISFGNVKSMREPTGWYTTKARTWGIDNK